MRTPPPPPSPRRSRPPSSSRPAEARGRHLVPGAGAAIARQRRRVRRSPGGRDSKARPGPKAVQKGQVNSNLEARMEVLMPEPQIFVERTLAIIKPDVIDKEEEIEDLILRSGFHIIQKRKLQLSPEQCSNFYAEQFGKMFFPNLTAYMSSGPIVAMVLARNCAVSYWKELLGPSNSLRARITHPHSLRALYGTDELRNGLHGSLSISSAEKEIRFIFPEAILEPIPTGQRARDYLNLYVKPTLLAGLTALCKEKPADPMIWLADWLIEHNPNKPKLQYRISQEGRWQ
ncbi:nucleoside diphosphate kinase homolog 5 isoform X1 [Onychostruthus taczanowskii]|uniref:nucleoside diphosphate kinase homolog 5 isoform X1 n=2 Tax=Onychostruthus taczanowskii TaxID=356909 RepID=UPI001B80043F|nr:nucleoside diphosphate kinase homolog 5 isoform X1 [Onychostruthus taczanowskii]